MKDEPLYASPKPIPEGKLRKRRTNAKARSAEYRTASALGGRRVPRSGAGPEEKGDVSVDDLPTPLFVEVKSVSTLDARGTQSVTFRREWLEKSVLDAEAAGKLPVVTMRFSDGTPVYATTAKVFEALIAQLRLYYTRANDGYVPPLTFAETLAHLQHLYEEK